MNRQDILREAIQKAIDGGWAGVPGRDYLHSSFVRDVSTEGVDKCYIFNHDFAKALWGEEPEYGIKRYGGERQDAGKFIPWEYHLQQMVIHPNPIEYLGENI